MKRSEMIKVIDNAVREWVYTSGGYLSDADEHTWDLVLKRIEEAGMLPPAKDVEYLRHETAEGTTVYGRYDVSCKAGQKVEDICLWELEDEA